MFYGGIQTMFPRQHKKEDTMKRTAKLVSLVLALVFVFALFAGCGGGQQQATPAPADNTPAATPQGTMTPSISKSEDPEVTEETKYADEITFGYADVGGVFSPLNANSAGQVSQIAYLMIYDTLLSRDPNDLEGYLPELATEWYADEEYKDWTFKLRDDVYFHNGEHLTAEDVRFSYIELTNDNPIAQMNFTLDGAEAYLRVQATGELAPIDISGLYYDWTEQREVSVGSCSGFACTNGEAGYIAWLDVVPGLAYNLGMTEGASIDRLTELAGLVYVPVQGDA